jgi:hypothetical protein
MIRLYVYMRWKSFQNKNKLHKDKFYKELGEVEYKRFDESETEFYTFLFSLFAKIRESLHDKSEKEWADMLQYSLQDLGFQTKTHTSYFNCFYFQENQICIVNKSSNPSILFKVKQDCSSILVISLQDIKEYCFEENKCIVKHL